MLLKYPKGLLISLKGKAELIRKKSTARKSRRRFITIPNFDKAEFIAKNLEAGGMSVAIASGRKVGDIVKRNRMHSSSADSMSIVYNIPCGGCLKSYVGETGRGLKTRIAEHKRDFKYHRISNALVVHADECGSLPNWSEVKTLEKGMSKPLRKTLEAAHIVIGNSLNSRAGFITWAETAAKICLPEDRRK